MAWRNREEQGLEQAEDDEAEKKAEDQAAKDALEEAENTLQELDDENVEQQTNIGEMQAQLRLLVTNHGEDGPRLRSLHEAGEASKVAREELEQTRVLLTGLQPEQLKRDHERLERAIQTQEDERQTARDNRAASRAEMTLDGSEDPQADLIRANALEQSARDHYESVKRKAEAVELLNRLFEEQQSVLADRFTQPLVDRISDYLKGIFGPGARALVTFDDGAFKGIQLVRPEHAGALSFDVLSGGTREQVAAAVRLAMAEVLATSHGGSLPVVFDDSFAFSDPNRVQDLQRMLDLAATRGLQVIVLTCNPSDYASLGARQCIFSQAAQAPATRMDGAGVPEDDAGALDETSMPASPTEEGCEAFISALEDLGGKSGNQTLRQNLGWTDEHYNAVKGRLIEQKRIVLGRGRGGSVALVS